MKYEVVMDSLLPAIKLNPKDDHMVYLIPLGYHDVHLYCVLYVDAYRTPTTEIMEREAIEKKFNVNITP